MGQAGLYVYFKDDVVVLRKHQIRTVFDMLPVCRDAQLMEKLAAVTEINALGFQLFCEKLTEDPVVRQLLIFQKRLCFAPEAKAHDEEELKIIEPDFGERQQVHLSSDRGHG